MKNLSSGWIFVKKSKANFFFRSPATVHLIETPPRRDPFWITRKNKEHRNPCDPGVDFIMEIHFEGGFPSVERRVLPQNPNSRFENQNPDSSKSSTQISLKTASSF